MGVFCQILLQRPPEGAFKPGSVMSGTVKYAVDEDTLYKDISLRLRGTGKCRWTRGSGKNKTHYYGQEDYLDITLNLLEKPMGHDETLIPIGSYSYPLHFVLPSNLPPTYSDKFSKIKYEVILTFKRKGLFDFNKVFRIEIPMACFLRMTLPGEPVTYGEHKTLMTLFRNDKNLIQMKVIIKRSILQPGEKAELYIAIKNESDTNVSGVEAHLFYEVTHIADCGGMRNDYQDVKGTKSEVEGVKEMCTANRMATVQIPMGHFSVQHSRVVSRVYKIKVKAKLPFPRFNLTLDIPVLIGDAGVEEAMEMNEECSGLEPICGKPPVTYWEVMQEDKLYQDK